MRAVRRCARRGKRRSAAAALGAIVLATAIPRVAAQEPPGRTVVTAPEWRGPAEPGVVHLDIEEARARGAETLADALAMVPGVTIQRSGSRFEPATARIRGSTPDQVALIVDGRPAGDVRTALADLARLPIDQIESVRVRRTAATTESGLGGAAGSIEVTLLAPEARRSGSTRGHASYSVTSLADQRMSAALNLPRGDSSLRLAVGGTIAASRYDVQRGGVTDQRENADGSELYTRIGSRTDRGDSRLTVTLDGALSERGIAGSVEFPSPEARLSDRRVTGSVSIAPRGDVDGPRVSASFAGMLAAREFDDPSYSLGAISQRATIARAAGDAAIGWQLGTNPPGGSLAAPTTIAHGAVVTLPVEILVEHLDDSELGDATRLGVALVPSLRGAISGRGGTATVMARARAQVLTERSDQPHEAELLPSGRLSIGVRPALGGVPLHLALTGAVGYRLPSYAELFQPEGAFTAGNQTLDPERSAALEASITLGEPPLSLEATLFVVWYRDLIQWLPDPAGRWRPLNTGAALSRGGELSLVGALPVGLTPWTASARLSFASAWALDRADGPTRNRQLPYRPEHGADASVAVAHLRGHRLTATLRSVGARPVTAQNTVWLDPYHLLDVAAEVALPLEGATLRASLFNLLDERVVDTQFLPLPGREIVVGIEWTW